MKNSKFINKIIVSTDNLKMQKIAIKLGAECPFIRKKNLSSNKTNLEKVVKYTLEQLERKNIFPDLIFQSLETFPFKNNSKIIDQMIMQLVKKGFDSVIAVKEQSSWLWHENEDNSFTRIDSGDVGEKFKRKSYTGLNGFGFITHSEFIRNMSTLGNNIGFYKVNDPMCNFEIFDKSSLDLAEYLLKNPNISLENGIHNNKKKKSELKQLGNFNLSNKKIFFLFPKTYDKKYSSYTFNTFDKIKDKEQLNLLEKVSRIHKRFINKISKLKIFTKANKANLRHFSFNALSALFFTKYLISKITPCWIYSDNVWKKYNDKNKISLLLFDYIFF